jgi:hypothetical protein
MPMPTRFKNKSTLASVSTDDDFVSDSDMLNHGSPLLKAKKPSHKKEHADQVPTTEQADWRVNLHRESDVWLHGPRESEWFTGVHPSECPGADAHGVIRSMALPNLSSVTRTEAKAYFDNSWTLYETLFAGLKGEEPFYRYVGSIACDLLRNVACANSLFVIAVHQYMVSDIRKYSTTGTRRASTSTS